MNEKNYHYGLPNLYPKLPKKITKNVKPSFSKYVSRSLDLFNPEPISYQRDTFKPSTIAKIFDIPKRFVDGFMDHELEESQLKRGIILHTERYIWSNVKKIYKNQNDRLIAEENYMKRVKYLKKLSETRLKIPNPNLVLEGENVPVGPQSTRPDPPPVLHINKGKCLFESSDDNSCGLTPPVTINSSSRFVEKEREDSHNSQPVYIAVQKIQLKNRMPESECISSAPTSTNQQSEDNANFPFQNTNSNHIHDRLPDILTASKDLNGGGRLSGVSFDPHFDYESLHCHSESINRPIGRINEYIMDGVSAKFTERADIQGEIKYLKSIILPSIARELYVGRGIQLPPNHAIKIPRGRFEGSCTNNKPDNNSEPSIGLPIEEDNRKRKQKHVNIPSSVAIRSHEKYPNIRDLIEQIKTSVPLNDNGCMDTPTLNHVLLQNSSLSEIWKTFMTTILLSIESINMEQLLMVLETEIISKPFQDDIPLLEAEESKQLIPLIFKLFTQTEDYLRFEDILHLLNGTNQLLSIQQIEEFHREFIMLITQNEHSTEKNIQKSQVLLFIPYILRRLKE